MRYLNRKEEIKVSSFLLDKIEEGFSVSGPERWKDWNQGWGEVTHDYKETKCFSDLIPVFPTISPKDKYRNILRDRGRFIEVEDSAKEYHDASVFGRKENAFYEYVSPDWSWVDIGCGLFVNSMGLAREFKKINYIGLDWVDSVESLGKEIAKNTGENIYGIKFDMFHPHHISLPKTFCVITSGSMEQLGTNHSKILKWILDIKPKIVIHFEPMYELYSNSVVDFTAKQYSKARNYLRGYLPALQGNNNIEIIKVERGVGCRYHEGETLVVWRPR